MGLKHRVLKLESHLGKEEAPIEYIFVSFRGTDGRSELSIIIDVKTGNQENRGGQATTEDFLHHVSELWGVNLSQAYYLGKNIPEDEL